MQITQDTATRQPLFVTAQQGKRLAQIGLVAFLLAMFLRPGDFIPALNSIRFVLISLTGTLIVFVMSARQVEYFRHPTSWWMLAFAAAVAVSIPDSYWPGRSTEALVDFVKQVVVFLLIVNLAADRSMLWTVALAMVGSTAVHAALAIKQFIVLGAAVPEVRIEGATDGIFGNANHLALNFVAMLPLGWWLLVTAKRKSMRCLVAGALLSLCGGLFACQSRGALLALGIAALVLAICDPKFRLTAAICGMVAIVTAPVAGSLTSMQRFSSISSYQTDESAQTRLAVWQAGCKMIADHPLTGVGARAFEVAYDRDYHIAKLGHNWWQAHNTLVQIGAELGLPGLIAWFMIVASCAAGLWRARSVGRFSSRPADSLVILHGCLLASLAGYCVAGLFVSRGYDWLLTVILAIGVASERVATNDAAHSAAGRDAGLPVESDLRASAR